MGQSRGTQGSDGVVGSAGRGGDAGGHGGTKWNRPTQAVPTRVVALLKVVSGGAARARGGWPWRGEEGGSARVREKWT